MARVIVETYANAPREVVFDLARDIDLHVQSTSSTGERAIAGRTSGLIEMGEEVTWRARHLGITQDFTSRVTAFDRPRRFRDVMVKGAFAAFEHDHEFEERDGGTLMRDVLVFRSPLGPLGRLVDAVFMTRYLRGFLVERNATIKVAAEELAATNTRGAGDVDRTDENRINIRHTDQIAHRGQFPEQGVPANVYRSANYFVVDIGLPRCQVQHVQVTLAPDGLLVEAQRHPGTGPSEEAREHLLHELPSGSVRRSFQIPGEQLALHEAEAHFANGMLTVSIPTKGRDEYRHDVRGEPVP